jgi:hypothetical protein
VQGNPGIEFNAQKVLFIGAWLEVNAGRMSRAKEPVRRLKTDEIHKLVGQNSPTCHGWCTTTRIAGKG